MKPSRSGLSPTKPWTKALERASVPAWAPRGVSRASAIAPAAPYAAVVRAEVSGERMGEEVACKHSINRGSVL